MISLPTRLLLCVLAALCLAGVLHAADPLQAGSFTRCLRNALQQFGVSSSAPELRLQLLLPFGPALATNVTCIEQASLAAEPLQLAHLAEATGAVSYTHLTLPTIYSV